MKFAVALTLASTAMAGIVARDATVVKAVISTVQTDIDSVKTAADAYTGDKTDLVSASDKLVSDLKDGKTKVEAGPDLTLNDAVDLGTAVQGLTKSGTALTESLTSRKSEVEKAGECKTVQDQIAAISENSKSLIDAVTAKVPEAARSIAESLSSQLTAVLAKAEESYKDCTNSGNGGSSSTGSATGTATGTSSATGTGSATGSSSSATGTATGTATHSSGAATTSCPPTGSATGTGGVKPTATSSQVTVPSGAAAAYAPAGVLAAVAAALVL